MRWNGVEIPDVNPNNVVDPQAVANYGQPNGGGVQTERTQARAELAQLERELAQVNARIAEFDRANPGLSSGGAELAANRMEMGDYGAYDSLVGNAYGQARNDAARNDATNAGVMNAIDEARKLAFGLDNESDETRAERVQNIRVMLDKAARDAEKGGVRLPREWYELNEQLNGRGGNGGGKSELQWLNELYSKSDAHKLTDADVSEMKDFIRNNPKSELSLKLQGIISRYGKKTVESRMRWRGESESAEKAAKKYTSMTRGDAAQFANRWNAGTDAEIKLLKKFYNYDYETGALVRK